MIYVDSNVIVAALAESHRHNQASALFLSATNPKKTVVPAHCIAETYGVLTRRNLPFSVSGDVAISLIEPFAERFLVFSLTAFQTLDAIRRFSTLGTGPRLYDYLIGATGETFGAHTIVTWNTRDFTGLFPALRIATPTEILA